MCAMMTGPRCLCKSNDGFHDILEPYIPVKNFTGIEGGDRYGS